MKALKRKLALTASAAVLSALAATAVALPRNSPFGVTPPPQPEQAPLLRGCFLLYDLGAGEIRRFSSQEGCSRRVAPAATFEIAAALAGLDSGSARSNDISGGQSLDSALAYSSPEYFRGVSEQMGAVRMGEYLSRFNYGNADTRSGGEYWNGGSLQISPEEQMQFLRRLFRDELGVSRQAMAQVREPLVQPPGLLVGSYGGMPVRRVFRYDNAPMLGKSGSVVVGGREAVRWQVGQIERGTRRYVFVSCVTGAAGLPENAAATLAVTELRKSGVL
ncbi:penicillin-binding transpeptidase domain-containing protein [Pseudomonas sp. CGJS7]|uniref:penicillin-binding transpeptidase domain-containing protein n=1 Tax=Pseudomonas sp. CGJS7 TaxID=3109348 RepID=UPI00300834D1